MGMCIECGEEAVRLRKDLCSVCFSKIWKEAGIDYSAEAKKKPELVNGVCPNCDSGKLIAIREFTNSEGFVDERGYICPLCSCEYTRKKRGFTT